MANRWLMEKSESLQKQLRNEEFRKLIPYMKIEDMFLTQALYNKEWVDIIRISNEVGRYRLECCLCGNKMDFVNLNSHLRDRVHIDVLKKVNEFYHPVYTSDYNYQKLVRWKNLPKIEVTSEAFEKKLRHVRQFLNSADEDKKTIFEEKLMQMALTTKARYIRHALNVFVEVTLPLKELLSVEFMSKDTKTWQRMLLSKEANSKHKIIYNCALCKKHCIGVNSLSLHLNAPGHKSNQLNTLIRCEYYPELTKHCIFRFGYEYSATVTPKGRSIFKDKVLKLLDIENESHTTQVSDTKTYKYIAKTHTTTLSYKPPVKDKIYQVEEVDDVADDVADGNAEGYEADETGIECNEAIDSDEFVECNDAGGDVKETTIEDRTVEDEIVTEDTTTAAIVAELDKEGLIGVEYVVQITDGKYAPFSYECTLCQVIANENKMQAHLIAYSHRLKYCEKHYPDTLTRYNKAISHMRRFEFSVMMSPILKNLASAIEKHHGRAIPYSIAASKYKNQRPRVVETINNFNHASQFFGPSFAHTLSRKKLAELMNLKCPYTPPEVPNRYRIRFTTTPTDKIYLAQNSHDPRTWKSRDSVDRELRSKSPHDQHRDRSSRSRKHSQESDRRDIWQIYRDQISTDASEIEYSYIQYRKNPESHPNYDHEWNRFWKRRKDQLASEGISHRSYDFQPEWIRFFRDRLEQMFDEALQKSKIDARRRLNIPLNAEEDSRPSREVSPPREMRLRSPARRNQAGSPFKRHSDNSEPAIKKPCFDTDTLISQWNSQSKPMQQQQYSSESGWGSYSSNQYNSEPLAIPTANDKPNIIHVLRLITALEDQLGSLGSKVMDLLSKALVLEKKCSNVELEQQILTVNNCSLLETAMEKLKGILFAGLLESHKIQGFNRVIQFTSDLLKHADKMGWRNNDSQDDNESTDSTSALQKFLDVIQSKRTDLPASNQKFLSDTLMNITSSQSINATDDRRPAMLNRSNFNFSNIGDSRHNRNNRGLNEMNHGSSQFNSNMNLNMNPNMSGGISGRNSKYRDGNDSGVACAGGNNFNNYNKTHTNVGMHASRMNNRFSNQSNNETAGYGQQTNHSSTHMNRMNTNNRNNFDIVGNTNSGIPNTGNGNNNWGRFEPYSYQNK